MNNYTFEDKRVPRLLGFFFQNYSQIFLLFLAGISVNIERGLAVYFEKKKKNLDHEI